MLKYIFLALIVSLFALNMGGSNFAAAFGAAIGGKTLSQKVAKVLFILSVILGAMVLGQPVTKTLSQGIVPKGIINFETTLVILISATFSLFIANLLHIPQSTSLVTVGAISGVGLYFGNVNMKAFSYMVPFWLFLPAIGYILTLWLGRVIYPPRKSNFWIYEKIVNHKDRLKAFIIVTSCYNAFACGTNNVANAVGPLVGANIVSQNIGLGLTAPIFGLGALLFPGPTETTSVKIVPLGLLTASIICLTSGTLMLLASGLGIPQSFVMLKMASLFAIGTLKDGHSYTFSSSIAKRTYLTWGITPILAVIISYLLVGIRYALFK